MNDINHPYYSIKTLEPWIISILIISFDPDKGQIIEGSFPKDSLIGHNSENIKFLGIPDKHIDKEIDLFYVFKIREQFGMPLFNTTPYEQNFIFGYTLFRSRRNNNIYRGAIQKSTVVLSKIPDYSFFRSVTIKIAQMYFDYGEVALESAFSSILEWPVPQIGMKCECPLFGDVLFIDFYRFSFLEYQMIQC